VLAHSLRDAGTKKKLAILVTLETVSVEVVTQLKARPNGPNLALCGMHTDFATSPYTTT
jgi:hypothetical protein